MNQRNFVLSWGRKVFFGQAWPLFCLLGLGYLAAQILPQSGQGVLYLIFNYIGLMGLYTCALYFFIYVPLAYIFPSYYFARLCAFSLLMSAGLLLFFDVVVFSRFRLHLNSTILRLAFNGSFKDIISFSIWVYVCWIFLFLGITMFLWMRGDRIWRGMQKRFRNTNSNWYFVLIAACLIFGHLLYLQAESTGELRTSVLSKVFPINATVDGRRFLTSIGLLEKRTPSPPEAYESGFFYPKKELDCRGKTNLNFLFIVLEGWGMDKMNEGSSPFIHHFSRHGQLFTNHYSGGNDRNSGIFSLLYSLPASYLKSAVELGRRPVLLEELSKKGLRPLFFSDGDPLERDMAKIFNIFELYQGQDLNQHWKNSLQADGQESTGRFFSVLMLGLDRGEQDLRVREAIEDLKSLKMLENTVILITGDHAKRANQQLDLADFSEENTKVPMILVWPGKKRELIDSRTTHFDFVPTVMREALNCTNPPSDYSFGHGLYDKGTVRPLLAGNFFYKAAIDFSSNKIITIGPDGAFKTTDLRSVPRSGTLEDDKDYLLALRKFQFFHKK